MKAKLTKFQNRHSVDVQIMLLRLKVLDAFLLFYIFYEKWTQNFRFLKHLLETLSKTKLFYQITDTGTFYLIERLNFVKYVLKSNQILFKHLNKRRDYLYRYYSCVLIISFYSFVENLQQLLSYQNLFDYNSISNQNVCNVVFENEYFWVQKHIENSCDYWVEGLYADFSLYFSLWDIVIDDFTIFDFMRWILKQKLKKIIQLN